MSTLQVVLPWCRHNVTFINGMDFTECQSKTMNVQYEHCRYGRYSCELFYGTIVLKR